MCNTGAKPGACVCCLKEIVKLGYSYSEATDEAACVWVAHLRWKMSVCVVCV